MVALLLGQRSILIDDHALRTTEVKMPAGALTRGQRWRAALATRSRWEWQLLALTAGAVLLRLVLIRWADNNYADAITRLFMTQDWLTRLATMPDSIWPPVPFWLNGLALAATDNPLIAPVVVTGVLGGLIVYPLARFVVLETGDKSSALLSAAVYALLPIAMLLSLLSLAEIPQALFFWVGLWFVARYRHQSHGVRDLAISAVAMNFAGACRFEVWFLFPFVALLYVRNLKHLLLYGAMLAVFPLFWAFHTQTLTHYWPEPIETGLKVLDRLQGHAAAGATGSEPFATGDLRSRLVAFPAVSIRSMSPVLAFFALFGVIRAVVDRQSLRPLALALVSAGVLIAGSLAAGWLLPERYFLLAVTLVTPYAGTGLAHFLRHLPGRWERRVVLVGVLASMILIPYIMAWSGDRASLRPVPRAEPSQRHVAAWLRQNVTPQDYLAVDHIDGFLDHWIVFAGRGSSQRTWITPGDFGGYRSDIEFPRDTFHAFVADNRPAYMVVTPRNAAGSRGGRLAEELGIALDGGATNVPELGVTLRPVLKTDIAWVFAVEYGAR